MILSTMCYIQKENQTLLLHRTKKEHDVNQGKWIGVGGKFEPGESAEDCMIREIYEETGLIANELNLHAFVCFSGLLDGEDEGMFIFTCHDFKGNLHECNEGELKWINNDEILSLPMWEGDHYFYQWIHDDFFHSAKLVYENDHLIEYQENHY